MANITAGRKHIAQGKVQATAQKASKRPRADTTSGSSASESEDGDDKAAMLAALQAHTRAMLGLDGPEEAESSAQGRKRMSASGSDVSGGEDGSDEDDDDGDEDEEGDAEGFTSDDGWREGDGMVTDSEDEAVLAVKPMSSASKAVPVHAAPSRVPEVVFDQTTSAKQDVLSKADRRAFLKGTSAKMMGLKPQVDYGPSSSKKRAREEAEGDEEDQSNLTLDKTLHDMLRTTLLPEHTASLASRPVDKRKAISGRLAELAEFEIPGEGGKAAHTAQLSKHSAKIRTGIIHAQAKRDHKAREEAKAAGSFVKGLGGLGGEGRGYKAEKGRGERAALGEDTGKKKGMAGRKHDGDKRDRGLSGGLGRFKGGMLTLTEREIERGNAVGERGRGRGRGRGGKRGGGGGRGGGGRGGGGGGGGRGGRR